MVVLLLQLTHSDGSVKGFLVSSVSLYIVLGKKKNGRLCLESVVLGRYIKMDNSVRSLLLLLLVVAGQALEKQIKLEDIEKDNLKSDQQAKFEKEYQQNYQADFQQYQQYLGSAGVNYQQPSAYQSQQGHQYSPYVLPYNQQPYLQQSLYQGNYNPLAGNGLPPQMAAAFQANAINPFQAYYSQQLQPVSGHSGHPHQQALVMAYSAPSLAAFQQQAAAYYGGQLQQYIPGAANQASHAPTPSAPVPQIPFYQPQPQELSAPASSSGPSSLYAQQAYVPQFQSISNPNRPAHELSQYSSPSAYSSNPAFSQSLEPLSLLANAKPQASSSPGIAQHYLQNSVSTVSPLQSKYLNSPHYLAQNYNTISSSVFPKSAYSGLKSTAAPAKLAQSGGFLPSNPSTSGSNNYHQYRSVSG